MAKETIETKNETVTIPLGTIIVLEDVELEYSGTVEVEANIAKQLKRIINGDTTND